MHNYAFVCSVDKMREKTHEENGWNGVPLESPFLLLLDKIWWDSQLDQYPKQQRPMQEWLSNMEHECFSSIILFSTWGKRKNITQPAWSKSLHGEN